MVIDEQMRIWQQGEVPIDIMILPYQKLKVMTNEMAARARTSAEWNRPTTIQMKVREVDRTASQVDPNMNEEDKGYERTAMMGGTMAKQEIAQFNEYCDEECEYCRAGASTAPHTR